MKIAKRITAFVVIVMMLVSALAMSVSAASPIDIIMTAVKEVPKFTPEQIVYIENILKCFGDPNANISAYAGKSFDAKDVKINVGFLAEDEEAVRNYTITEENANIIAAAIRKLNTYAAGFNYNYRDPGVDPQTVQDLINEGAEQLGCKVRLGKEKDHVLNLVIYGPNGEYIPVDDEPVKPTGYEFAPIIGGFALVLVAAAAAFVLVKRARKVAE